MLNTSATPTKKIDTKVLLSTLWIVVMINMLTADILSLYIPGATDEVAKFAGGTPIAQLMLGGAVMMEISAVMIVLAQVLKGKANRWANSIASIITGVFVVGGGTTNPHYIFLEVLTLVCLVLIIWTSWKGDRSSEQSSQQTA